MTSTRSPARPAARALRRRGHSPVLRGLALALGTALLLAAPAAGVGGGSAPGADVSVAGQIGTVLRDQIEAGRIPGGAVAVVSPDEVVARAAGTDGASREVTPDMPFVIGSASKSVTALAVMQLVDSGAVDLDAPARSYVPELELAPGEPVGDITVRHLLQHTSGLDDLAGGAILASARDGTPRDAVAELREAELASSPGSNWRYANANYVLAGLVVENVSGLPYDEYVRQRIFDPLGMTHSHVTLADAESDGLSQGHRFWFGLPVQEQPTARRATLAAGYLVSSAEDLGRYLTVYLDDGVGPDGTRVVSSAAIRTLTRPGPEAPLGPWADGRGSRYAMGWFVGGPWGESAVFHPGNTPDTTTMLALFPDDGVAVAVLLNAGNELPVPGNPFIADRVARNVVHAAVGQPTAPLPSHARFYLYFDLVALALVTLSGYLLLRAVRRLRHHDVVRRRLLGWAGAVTEAVTAAALLYLPASSSGWGGLWTWAPDLALLMAVVATLLALAAAVRVATLLGRPRSTEQTSTDSEGSTLHVHA